jgi:cysteine protease ATG4
MSRQRSSNNTWQSAVSSTSPKLANAMEVAKAAGAEVGRVGRRILQKIWDPEPVNDRASNEPVWLLGRCYTLPKNPEPQPAPHRANTPPAEGVSLAAAAGPTSTGAETSPSTTTSLGVEQVPETPPDSTASSVDSSLAYDEESGEDGGWPPAFLDDFESRIWMTYRMGFELIPKSSDPKASAALSFTMRLKTSFGDFMGFTSDTGWGCMIRSGQSLLANALAISRLGRGMFLSLAFQLSNRI